MCMTRKSFVTLSWKDGEAKDKSNHLVAYSLRQFPRTQHNITHTTTHGEGGHNKRDTGKTREERRKKAHVVFFFLHVMAVVPLTFHNVTNFFASRYSFTLFHRLTLLNLWKSARNFSEKHKMDTLWKVNGFFCDTASSPFLHHRSCWS